MNQSYKIIVEELVVMDAEWGHIWKTPPLHDCLKFVYCELAEAVDAELRLSGEYFRNRDFSKTMDEYYAEICDAIMMLCKALMSVEYPHDFNRDPIPMDLQRCLYITGEKICNMLGSDVDYMAGKGASKINYSEIEDMLLDLAYSIDALMGIGYAAYIITEKLQKTRNKIKAKLEAEEKTNEQPNNDQD